MTPYAPLGSRLLPVLPAVALVIAFVLNRIRLTLMETAGTWLENSSNYLIIGFVLWAGLQGWLTYIEYVNRGYEYVINDRGTYTGQVVRTMPDRQTAILLNEADSSAPLSCEDPVLAFLSGLVRGERPLMEIQN